MTGIIGREGEFAQLAQLLESARDGTSQVLVLEGEAGIGKTTLLNATAAHGSRFRVLRVNGVQSERALAFAALHRLLMPVLDHVDGLPDHQRQALEGVFGVSEVAPARFLVGLATLTLLTDVAAAEPLLCVIDDAQWIDTESLEIFSFVGRRLHADAVALLLAIRVESGDAAPIAEGLPRLRLAGLNPGDAHALLAEAAPTRVDDDVARRIVDESSGSPLAIVEVASALSAEQLAGGKRLPEALPLGARLEGHYLNAVDALPAQTGSFLLVAAADSSGDAAVVRVAARSLDLPTDAADPAVHARLLTLEPRVEFRHPLIRSAVYGRVKPESRRAVHRALAAAVGDSDLDARAWHLASSAVMPDSAIAEELAERAARVHERGGFATEAAFLTRSAELTANAGARAARLVEAARAHHMAGAPQAAETLLSLAEPSISDELLRVEALRLRAMLQSYTAPSSVPAILLAAAQRLLPLDAARARATFGEALQACLVSWQFTADTTPADVARAALATSLLDDADDAVPLMQRGIALRLTGDFAEAAHALRQAVTVVSSGPSGLVGFEHWPVMLSHVAPDLWDIDRGWPLARAMEAYSRERGALEALRTMLGSSAHYAMWSGRFAEAEAAHAEAAAIADALGEEQFVWQLQAVEVYAWQDDEPRTLQVGELLTGELAKSYGAGVISHVGRAGLVVLHLADGRYRQALDAAWPSFVDDMPLWGNNVLPSIIEAAVRCDQQDAASAALERLSERATEAGTPWALGVLARGRALTCPDASAAERYYRESVDQLQRSPVATELARSHLLLGEWLRRQGRRIEARESLGAAMDLFSEMGAAGFARRARTELEAAGAAVREPTAVRGNDLTPQEFQIAQLASAGDTNREIAAKLYISAATVDYHLRKVFQKLGLTSRRQIRGVLF